MKTKTYIKRLKTIWKEATLHGKVILLIFMPIWLLAGLNDYWDDEMHSIHFDK